MWVLRLMFEFELLSVAAVFDVVKLGPASFSSALSVLLTFMLELKLIGVVLVKIDLGASNMGIMVSSSLLVLLTMRVSETPFKLSWFE